jgi:GGDEF domain-containing protein
VGDRGLDQMNKKAALLFIDQDGFTPVNDSPSMKEGL